MFLKNFDFLPSSASICSCWGSLEPIPALSGWKALYQHLHVLFEVRGSLSTLRESTQTCGRACKLHLEGTKKGILLPWDTRATRVSLTYFCSINLISLWKIHGWSSHCVRWVLKCQSAARFVSLLTNTTGYIMIFFSLQFKLQTWEHVAPVSQITHLYQTR